MADTAGDRPKDRAPRFPALRSREFRTYWLAEFVSRTGSHVQNTALNWHVYLLTGSPVSLGMLGLLRFIPVVLLSLVGGAVADAVNRRRLMLVTQSVLMVNAGVLGWMTLHGRISLPAIYAITAASAAAVAFDNPARQSLMPNLVPREHLANAFSLSSTLFQVATIIGPMLAGLMIGARGGRLSLTPSPQALSPEMSSIGFTYWVNAASFLVVIAALAAIRPRESKGDSRSVSIRGLREGLAFVRDTPVMLGLMLLDAVATFFSSANALLPIFAREVLRVGPEGYGVLAAASATGAVGAAGVLSLRPAIRRQGTVVLVAIAIHGLATLGFGVSRWFWASCLLLAVAGAGDMVSTVLRQTIRQIITPDRLRGRVSAVNMVFAMGGPRLGEMEAGLVANWIGASGSVVSGGIGCIVTAGAIAWLLPAVRRYVHKA